MDKSVSVEADGCWVQSHSEMLMNESFCLDSSVGTPSSDTVSQEEVGHMTEVLITRSVTLIIRWRWKKHLIFLHRKGRMSARGGKKKITKLSRSSRAGVIFPVGRMMRYLRTGTHKYRIGMGAPVYMAAVIEYLAGGNPESPLLWNEIMFYQKIYCHYAIV